MTRPYVTPQERAEAFNHAVPLGTPVRYWPGVREGEGVESKTRTPAWVTWAGDPLVSVEGYPGGIALTHVELCGNTQEES